MRKRRVDGVREPHKTAVPCPEQSRDYSETFHQIDKGNMVEAKYDIALESKTHGWTPKLACRYFNINLNNAYKIYVFLVEKYTPGRRFYTMGEAVKEGAHAFLQKGEAMRIHKCEHPAATIDLSKM